MNDAGIRFGEGETVARPVHHHALGLRQPCGKVVDFVGNDTVMYMVGRHASCYDLESMTHRFVLKAQKTLDIICFCVSANRKYIALAERLPEGLQINIYTESTGSKVRSLEFKYLTKLPIVSMCFSTDNKYLVAATALPDVFIYLWQVDKSRLVGMVDVAFEVTKVSISPWAYWSLCTTGTSAMRLWRLVDKQLRPTDPIPKRRDGGAVGMRFTSHCWYDDEKLAACTEEGDIVIVEQAEVKRIIRGIHGEGLGLYSITSIARGLIVSGDGGLVSLLTRTYDDTIYFQPLRRYTSVADSKVVDLAVSPKEEVLAVAYANNTIATVQIESIEAQRDRDCPPLVPIAVGFHADTVTCVDVCAQKSFVVTGSLDKTIRVWNFIRKRMEFVKTFDEEILSLSLHPTGLRIVVGLKSTLRMFNMLGNDLHPCTDFPVKLCNEVRFSSGGQFFAAVVAHRILVFNSYDFSCTAQLSGHTVMVKGVGWSRDDQFLVSTDLNGVAYTWCLEGQKRLDTDDARKGVSYSGTIHDATSRSVCVYGVSRSAEGTLAEGEVTVRCIVADREPNIVRPGVIAVRQPSQRKFHTRELALSSVAQTLFVGLPNGSLALYRYPLGDDAQPYQRLEIHEGEILFVVLSVDERSLFTLGSDNTLFMFDVEALCDGRTVSRKPFNYAAFDDVCYMLQSDVTDRAREVRNLKDELTSIIHAKERDETLLTQRFEDERNDMERSMQAQISKLDEELRLAKERRNEIDRAMQESSKNTETMHLRAAEELEALYTRRTEEANAKYNQLRMERDDVIVRYENKLFKVHKEQECERKRMDERLKETESRLGEEIDALKRHLNDERTMQDAMLDQAIVDYESLVDEMKHDHREVMDKKEEDLSKAINNASTGERDAERLKKDKGILLDQLRDRDSKVNELEGLAEKRKRENEAQKKEMAVRFESINVAERKIQQLKKQTTELEKLRYVLTFKYNELKREVAPKEKQLEHMTQRVEEMDSELEKVTGDREQLRRLLRHRDDKLSAVVRESSKYKQDMSDRDRSMETLLRELTLVVNECDPKRMVYQVKDLLLRYDDQEGRAEAVVEENRIAEFERQRSYMEAQLSCVRRQNRQKEGNLRMDNQRSTSENASLVKEINELRHEKKLLANKCQLVESQLKDARTALQRASVAADAPPRSEHKDEGGERKETSQTSHATRGRLIRGPTRALKDIAHLDTDKVSRIISQVERNNAEMERQQEEIVRLREFVGHLLSRADMYKDNYTAEDRQRHEDIRNAIQE